MPPPTTPPDPSRPAAAGERQTAGGSATDASADAGTARWFAANTQPLGEIKALVNLERQGFRAFLPRIARTIRSGRRVRNELRALFPGYVFVELDLRADRWRSVDGTFGVRTLVKSGDIPSPLPRGVVEALMQMTRSDGRVSFSSAMAAGDKVRFLTGPFADLVGSLEHLDEGGRVRVLLNILGRETAVKADASQLLPLK